MSHLSLYKSANQFSKPPIVVLSPYTWARFLVTVKMKYIKGIIHHKIIMQYMTNLFIWVVLQAQSLENGFKLLRSQSNWVLIVCDGIFGLAHWQCYSGRSTTGLLQCSPVHVDRWNTTNQTQQLQESGFNAFFGWSIDNNWWENKSNKHISLSTILHWVHQVCQKQLYETWSLQNSL